MLGSDPIAALLGAGMDPRLPEVLWKGYLRRLVNAGAAVTMLGPDVVVPDDATDAERAGLATLVSTYPTGTQMPMETTGKLAGTGLIDAAAERVNVRVGAYYRRINRTVGKDVAAGLWRRGAITTSAAIHAGASNMVAVMIGDAASLRVWRQWSMQASGDGYERHSAPTLLVPQLRGGGMYLFRTSEGDRIDPLTMAVTGWEDCSITVTSGDMLVPVPPTCQNGAPVTRLGPCRMLPGWLRESLLGYGVPPQSAAA
ncbi:hypothetical protein ACNQR9_00150 [Mycolicibacterium peregrinum]